MNRQNKIESDGTKIESMEQDRVFPLNFQKIDIFGKTTKGSPTLKIVLA